nr:MAG TPA: DNA methyl phosphotriester repair domain protein [Caudoviricetes sp.]
MKAKISIVAAVLVIILSGCTDPGGTQTASAYPSVKETTVYITETGTKYHRWSCRYLKDSCIEISLTNATSRGYTACSVCNP